MTLHHEPHPLELLTLGLLNFLDEVEVHRQVCIRHAPSTSIVDGRQGALRITRHYRCLGESRRHLRAHVRLLGRVIHQGLCNKGEPADRQVPSGQVLFSDWIMWEGNLTWTALLMSAGVLRVTTVTPYPDGDLPVHPVKRVAQALLCQESLVPVVGLEPIRIHRNAKGLWPIQVFLLRCARSDSIPPASTFLHWSAD